MELKRRTRLSQAKTTGFVLQFPRCQLLRTPKGSAAPPAFTAPKFQAHPAFVALTQRCSNKPGRQQGTANQRSIRCQRGGSTETSACFPPKTHTQDDRTVTVFLDDASGSVSSSFFSCQLIKGRVKEKQKHSTHTKEKINPPQIKLKHRLPQRGPDTDKDCSSLLVYAQECFLNMDLMAE